MSHPRRRLLGRLAGPHELLEAPSCILEKLREFCPTLFQIFQQCSMCCMAYFCATREIHMFEEMHMFQEIHTFAATVLFPQKHQCVRDRASASYCGSRTAARSRSHSRESAHLQAACAWCQNAHVHFPTAKR